MAKQEKLMKIFNDSVHGHIEMHPLLVKIIDTPEFQRLRNIKQLGGGYFVFPGASHNRFEHSIGVAHLAGQLVKSLQESLQESLKESLKKSRKESRKESRKKSRRESLDYPPNLVITDEEVLCVQIAGLCHDLGHGPFSHTFEEFMKKCHPEEKWKHEEQSIKMFEQLIRHGDIKAIMEDYDLVQRHIETIKKLINPPEVLTQEDKEKPFLYEIVANKRTGIDVDKMDYFIRDCHHLGMKSNFSHERYMMFARVCTKELIITEDGQEQIRDMDAQICMRDKEAINMYELFHTRNILHQNAYQHRVKIAVELMILDALIAADAGKFKIQMEEKNVTITDAVKEPKHFVNLTDDILQQIRLSADPDKNLSAAKTIIDRITQRKLYKLIGSKLFNPKELTHLDSAEKWKKKVETWVEKLKEDKNLPFSEINASDFEAKPVKIDYGMKDKDPVNALLFYGKKDQDTARTLSKEEVSEIKVMLFYKPDDQRFENLTKEQNDLFQKKISEMFLSLKTE